MAVVSNTGGSKPWPDLRKAIRERLLTLAFQPIVRTVSGDVIAVEALTRPLPESGFPNPGVLFAAAEAFNLSWELEIAVRERLAELAATLPADRLMFFNTSPKVFADPRYTAEIERFREQSGLGPERFVLEITERAEGGEAAALERNALALREMGYQIAIDDIGAGSSGLNRIMALRPAWLKLDRELVRGIDKDAYRQNLVRFLAYFTRLGGAHLIAEGVEELDELNTLFDLGADCVQGFALGRPGEIDQDLDESLTSWMRERGAVAVREPSFIERIRSIEPLTIPVSACRTAPDATHAALDINATIADALLALADRSEIDRMSPLGATNASGGRLAVRASDLIRAAAKQLGEESLHSSPMFELPDSLSCDVAMHRRIAGADASDVAVIDIRRMSEYNTAVGHDLGDLLLRHLATLLRSTASVRAGSFVGHLGDDRFLLIASPSAVSEIIEEVVLRFDRASMRYASNSTGSSDARAAGWLEAPSLRVVMIQSPFTTATNPREIRRIAEAARRHAPSREMGGSRIIVADPAALESEWRTSLRAA